MPDKITALTSDGKKKTFIWYKTEDPTQDDIDGAPEYQIPKPSFLQRLGTGLADLPRTLFEDVSTRGKNASDALLKGDYYGMLNNLISPITGPMQRSAELLVTDKKMEHPVIEGLEYAGIPATSMAEAYKEGDYARLGGQTATTAAMFALGLRGSKPKVKNQPKVNTTKIPNTERVPVSRPEIIPEPPKVTTSFEGLSRNPDPVSSVERPHIDGMQQGLPLEFPPQETQLTLPQRRYKEDRPSHDKPIIGPQQPDLFTENVPRADVTGTTIPSELEPRLLGNDRPSWSRFAEQRNLPFDVDTLTKAESSGVPEVVKAVKQVVQSPEANPVSFRRSRGWKDIRGKVSTVKRVFQETFWKSDKQTLRDDSPAGSRIADMIDKFRTEAGYISGQASAMIKNAVDPLNGDQRAEWQMLLDKGGKSNDPMVNVALDVARQLDDQFTSRAVASGLHIRLPNGDLVPFTGKENYWPRMYDPALFKDKPALIERLIKQGFSAEQATNIVNNSRRFGERLIDPQHARVLDLPEHRKDVGALLKHYDDMAFRIAAAEEFGVKDIADPATPISKLVENVKDHPRVTDILTRYLERDPATVRPHDVEFTKKATRLATAFYLSKFAISNTNQVAMIPIVTNLNATRKALTQFISKPRKTWREAEATGALQTVFQEALREVDGESRISKLYGIKASEGSNRAIAAIAGKHYAIDQFAKAKKGNVTAQRNLERLTLEKWENLKNQDALNEKQQAYAATRASELSQGRAQSIDLPHNWSANPYMGLLVLYKKFAFVQNKLLKDNLKADQSKPFSPTNIDPKKLALALALFQATGELTGDAKALVMGGSPADRGEGINRVLQNYTDAMFLGLIASIAYSASSGKQSMYNFGAGPVFSFPIEAYGNLLSDAKNNSVGGRIAKGKMPDFQKSQFLRQMTRSLPFSKQMFPPAK